MIHLFKSTSESFETPLKHLPFMREEKIILNAQNYVSDPITFKKGETRFTLEAPIIKRQFLLISLGGININGSITTFWLKGTKRELSINEYQWLIIKADFLKDNQSLEVKIKFF
jgi:hypothetical protein